MGPLKDVDFKEPTAKTENLYFKSINETIDNFRAALREVKNDDLKTPNINLDTGNPTQTRQISPGRRDLSHAIGQPGS